MTTEDIIRDAKEKAAEYLEMTDNPSAVIEGMLAYKILKLQEQITYLERRINNARTIRT